MRSYSVEAVTAAGFTVDRVAEPLPSPEAVARFPEDLAHLAGEPTFIVYRLWLGSPPTQG